MFKQTAVDYNSFQDQQETKLIVQSNNEVRSLEELQESIYSFFLEGIKGQPEAVLQDFKHLFIQDADAGSSAPIRAIYEIVFINNQEVFHYTLKRCCYILVNNWLAKRNHNAVQELIEVFTDSIIRRKSLSPTINRLRTWVQIFINSKDYQELELYAYTKSQAQSRCKKNHASYLLASQYANSKNPIEQREAAKNRAQQLKYRFKLDLAMYMARFESATNNQQLKNPTEIKDEVLRIIKIITAKQDIYKYANMATTFIKQVNKQKYKEFKQSLQKYLFCFGEDKAFSETLKLSISKKIATLYEMYSDQTVNEAILLKTCNKLIEGLTTENHQQPSPLLSMLISQGHPLTVVIMLLKIVLICPSVREHLESCIADLIRYHEKYPEECNWMINFIEIFNVMFAIYVDKTSLALN